MTSVVEFLTARYDEIEATARGAMWNEDSGTWRSGSSQYVNAYVVDDLDDGIATVDPEAVEAREAAAHIALHDPAYVLADIAAKRYVLGQLSIPTSEYEFTTHHFNVGAVPTERDHRRSWRMLKALALPFKDHPDYQPEWTPYKYDPSYREEHWPWPDWADNDFPGFRNHSID